MVNDIAQHQSLSSLTVMSQCMQSSSASFLYTASTYAKPCSYATAVSVCSGGSHLKVWAHAGQRVIVLWQVAQLLLEEPEARAGQ